MTNNKFIGTWRLLSLEIRDANGLVNHPFGKNAVGYLIYTTEGYMSATLMKANRLPFSAGDRFSASTEELVSAALTYESYCGCYEIKSNKVIHKVEASQFPNWIGIHQERYFEFAGNKLLLSTPPMLFSGKEQNVYVTWERILEDSK